MKEKNVNFSRQAFNRRKKRNAFCVAKILISVQEKNEMLVVSMGSIHHEREMVIHDTRVFCWSIDSFQPVAHAKRAIFARVRTHTFVDKFTFRLVPVNIPNKSHISSDATNTSNEGIKYDENEPIILTSAHQLFPSFIVICCCRRCSLWNLKIIFEKPFSFSSVGRKKKIWKSNGKWTTIWWCAPGRRLLRNERTCHSVIALHWWCYSFHIRERIQLFLCRFKWIDVDFHRRWHRCCFCCRRLAMKRISFLLDAFKLSARKKDYQFTYEWIFVPDWMHLSATQAPHDTDVCSNECVCAIVCVLLKSWKLLVKCENRRQRRDIIQPIEHILCN